jgi:hypothetical protein
MILQSPNYHAHFMAIWTPVLLPIAKQREWYICDAGYKANELAALKEGPLYAWAQLSLFDFGIRLGGIWLFFFVLLGAPIAWASFDPNRVSISLHRKLNLCIHNMKRISIFDTLE